MSQNMEDTQVKARVESQLTDAPVSESRSNSRFDDAEYERWSEKLRASRSKNK
jgi:hypothetical protein